MEKEMEDQEGQARMFKPANAEGQPAATHLEATPHAAEREERYRYERPAMQIVEAIKRDIMPTMDSNDGGEILGWILDLCVSITRSQICPSREAWEAGFKLAVSYGDNWFHFDGEQKERQWERFVAATERTSEPVSAEILSSERTDSDGPRDKSSSVALETYQTLAASLADALTEIERLTSALQKVNAIRDSIIGTQTLNWSEHIYPLVAALEDAGFKGMGYDKGRVYFGTMLERTLKAESEVERLNRQIEGFYRGNTRPEHPPCERFLRLAHAGPSDVCATCGHHEHQHGVELQQAHQWQPFGSVPQDSTYVLVWAEYEGVSVYRFGPGLLSQPDDPQWTHWMPLPLPPLPDLGERKT